MVLDVSVGIDRVSPEYSYSLLSGLGGYAACFSVPALALFLSAVRT